MMLYTHKTLSNVMLVVVASSSRISSYATQDLNSEPIYCTHRKEFVCNCTYVLLRHRRDVMMIIISIMIIA